MPKPIAIGKRRTGMMKTLALEKSTASIHSTTVTHKVTVTGRAVTTSTTTTITINTIYNYNDSAHAGSLSYLNIPISHFNKNFFMKTVLQYFKRSVLVLLLLTSAMFFSKQSIGQGSQTFSTPGTATFTVPVGVTSVRVECWGAGAGGSNNTNTGGGGGAFAGNNAVAVTPGTNITITVGAGGDANAGSNIGGNSSFGSFVIAAGANANTGGQAGSSTGTIIFSGGNGGSSTSSGGAGGGGSAGAGGAGGNGGNTSNSTGGVAGAAGAAGAGTAGATGGTGGGTGNNNGGTGNAPGGGGGERSSSGGTSGVGAGGRVIITWVCPAASISYNFSSFCKSVSSASINFSGTSGGTFSSTAGLALNTSTGEINPSTSTSGTYTVHYQMATGGQGCSAINATTNVTISGTPVTSVTGQSDISCFAGSDGTITIAATGGAGPYFFSVDNGATWTPTTHASTYTYGGLSANTQYRIKVKDSNGCESK